ncbi:hypothetical protein BN940_12186 [Castellaniella defragrans 65Phen]|uniref:Uncharacterized protein n=1 Tax=Castellaniella defragrans (strain DSM 12143 / CCUG 39792 / 65Phen) TaxID=1437824 RepID=W8WYQ4_CASD6|nr:hypothetical protein BN940_12186 [Castellaniella defragrans 65Phen]
MPPGWARTWGGPHGLPMPGESERHAGREADASRHSPRSATTNIY